jgi:hypothetical protein
MQTPQTSETQPCGSCKQVLPLDEFSPSYRGKSGTWCRACFSAYNRKARPHVQHDPIPCDFCGKDFVPRQLKPSQPNRFCSNNCKTRFAYWKKNPRGVHECVVCGAEISGRRRDVRYCSPGCARKQRSDDGRLKVTNRKSRLARYGLTQETYDALLAEQGGGCAICKSPDPKTQHGFWHADHDHACCPSRDQYTCGKCLRGLLCGPCNTGLGQFDDDPVRLKAAIEYLKR